jgi:hypothetical protein
MKYLLLLLLFVCTNVHAQKFRKDLSAEEYVSTSDYGIEVPIKKFSFRPYHLLKYNRSVDSNIIYLYFENKDYYQYLICLDVNADSIVHGFHLKDGINSAKGYKDYYVVSGTYVTSVYNSKSGDLMWKFNGHLFHVDVKNNIGIDDEGKAYDMFTGAEKWFMNIDQTFGVDNIWAPDSNWILFVANGLQFINTKTGTGWFHHINTGIAHTKEYIPLLPDIYYGIELFQSRRKTMSKANSNIRQVGQCYYFAGIDEMICVNMAGVVQWKTKLPANSGFSYLEVVNGTVFLISTGITIVNNFPAAYSIPYIAAFDKDNGNLYYNTMLEKEALIWDYDIDDNGILLTTSNAIRVYDTRTGKIKNKLMLDNYDKVFSEHKRFYSGESLFVDSTLGSKKSLAKLFPDNFFLMNRNGNVLRLNYTLDTFDVIKSSALYYKREISKDITITSSLNGKKVFIDKSGKRLFRHGTTPDIQIGNKLLFIEKDAMYIADLSGL